jgi:inosine-uridine nucleoside N-ribohydrolase
MARFAASADPVHQALARAVAAWHPAQSWKPGPVMYDLFPLVTAIAPACYRLTETPIAVVTDGPLRGRTITSAGPAMQVTTGIDVAALSALYWSTVFPTRG